MFQSDLSNKYYLRYVNRYNLYGGIDENLLRKEKLKAKAEAAIHVANLAIIKARKAQIVAEVAINTAKQKNKELVNLNRHSDNQLGGLYGTLGHISELPEGISKRSFKLNTRLLSEVFTQF
jgi:hypothetical protein